MSPENAMTYTPALGVTEDGQEYIDTENGSLDTSEHREAVNLHRARNPNENFWEDENGEVFYQDNPTGADIPVLHEIVGGEETFNDMLAWASDTLADEDIDDFNNIIQNGDITEVKNTILQLKEMYENGFDPSMEPDAVTEYIFENIVSPQEYGDIVDFVRSNLGDEEIDTYNSIIDSGDIKTITNLIQSIQARL